MTKEEKGKNIEDLVMQYDEHAKKALGYKTILAFILSKTVLEFKEMQVGDIVELIEGEIYIDQVPVDPGHTNTMKGERITGFNNENFEINEGLIRYDILFKVRTDRNSKETYGIIINVEMQKDEPTEYKLVNRAIFYVCRLISAEKQREFKHMKFNDMVKVYSIWIVANMKSNSVNHIHFTQDNLYGSYKWTGGLDMANIIIIGITGEVEDIADEPKSKDTNGKELCKMLNTLFNINLSNDERFKMLSDNFDIIVDEGLREEVEEMCNLGQGLLEKGEKRGEKKGEKRGEAKAKIEDIISFYKVGGSLVMIAQAMSKSEEEIRQILLDNGVDMDH